MSTCIADERFVLLPDGTKPEEWKGTSKHDRSQ